MTMRSNYRQAIASAAANMRPTAGHILLMCAALLLGACGANDMTGQSPTIAPAATSAVAPTADAGETTESGEGVETGLPGGEEAPGDEQGVETGLPGGEEGGASGAETISFSEIADNPDQWVGQTVTVRGDLDEKLGQRAFTLTEPGLGADSFLVIPRGDGTAPMNEPIFGERGVDAGEQVQVTGLVQRYDRATLEGNLGAELQEDLFAAYTQEDLVILATTINVIGDQANDTGAGGDIDTDTGTGAAETLTVAQIMEDPEQYIGQQITITGDAEEIIGSRAIKLDEDNALSGGIDNDLLAVGATATEPQFDNSLLDEPVTVSGTLRMFNREQIVADLGYDLDANLFADWDNQPVLVADTVTPVTSQ